MRGLETCDTTMKMIQSIVTVDRHGGSDTWSDRRMWMVMAQEKEEWQQLENDFVESTGYILE